MRAPRLWCTDFDGTLTEFEGDGRCPVALAELLMRHRARGGLWAINTGRTLESMLEGLDQFGAPAPPDFLLTSEREIFRRTREGGWEPYGDWNARCAREHAEFFFSHRALFEEVERWAATFPGLHFVREDDGQPAGLVAASEQTLERALPALHQLAACSPDFSYQRNAIYLRFCHRAYDKGAVLGELCRLEGLTPADVVAAGDNHNDLSMLHPSRAAFLACPRNAVEEVQQAVRGHRGIAAAFNGGRGTAQALAIYFSACSASSSSEEKAEGVGARISDS